MIKFDLSKMLGFRIAGVDTKSKSGSMVGSKGGATVGTKGGTST